MNVFNDASQQHFLQGVQGLKFVVNTIKSHFLNTIRSFVYFSQMKYIDYAFSLSKNGIEQTLDLLLKMTSNLTTYWDYLSLNLMQNFNILFHFFFTISSSRKKWRIFFIKSFMTSLWFLQLKYTLETTSRSWPSKVLHQYKLL